MKSLLFVLPCCCFQLVPSWISVCRNRHAASQRIGGCCRVGSWHRTFHHAEEGDAEGIFMPGWFVSGFKLGVPLAYNLDLNSRIYLSSNDGH